MVSDISNSRNYEWTLTSNGVPDMRLRQNRENMIEMAKDLSRSLASEESEIKRFMCGGKVETTCRICMEEMKGRVTMKCGHEMCPDCFAKHARVNHTCPFCRDEFTTKQKERQHISAESIMVMSDRMFESVSEDYFSRATQVVRGTNLVEGTHYMEYLIKMNAMMLGRQVADWYDN